MMNKKFPYDIPKYVLFWAIEECRRDSLMGSNQSR